MKTKRHHKQVSEKEFKALKALIDAGVSSSVFERATGRGWHVYNFVKKSNSLEEYTKNTRDYMAKYRVKNSNTGVVTEKAEQEIAGVFANAQVELKKALNTVDEILINLQSIKTVVEAIDARLAEEKGSFTFPYTTWSGRTTTRPAKGS